MSDDITVGNERIMAAVDKARRYGKPIIFVEHLRNFGDSMHSTIVIRHYRRAMPGAYIIFGVSERYASEYDTIKGHAQGPHDVVGLPHGPSYPYDGPVRIAWTKYAATLPGVVKVVTPSVHPYGWKCGTIADAILYNAGITHLLVPRRPFLPVDISDYVWADQFMRDHGLTVPYVTMEYTSYSLGSHNIDWYANLVRLIKSPVVAISGPNDKFVPGTIHCKHATYRQAKVLIMRSRCFIGCASGNGLLAVSEECETPIVDIIDDSLSFRKLGYIITNRVYINTGFDRTPEYVASVVNTFV